MKEDGAVWQHPKLCSFILGLAASVLCVGLIHPEMLVSRGRAAGRRRPACGCSPHACRFINSARSGKGKKRRPSILKRSAAFHLHNIAKIGSILPRERCCKNSPGVCCFWADYDSFLSRCPNSSLKLFLKAAALCPGTGSWNHLHPQVHTRSLIVL